MAVFSALTASSKQLLVVCMLLAISGCGAGPDIRSITGEGASSASADEGRRLLDQGRAVEAVTAFRAHLRSYGEDLQGLNGLAIAYSELGRPDLAAEMFSRALALAPRDPVTLNNIGFSALRRADPMLARHYLEKASDRKSDHQEIQGNLARLVLLERMDPMRPAMLLADRTDPLADSGLVNAVRHLTLPNGDRRIAITEPPVEAAPSSRSTATLIDFTNVVDPFFPGE